MRLIFLFILLCGSSLSQNIILRNVNIIPVNHEITIRDCNVFIRDGKIEKITPYPYVKEPGKKAKKKESTAGYVIHDCEGRYLIPGLADMHAHFPAKDHPLHLQDFLRLNLAAGVTVVRSMRGEGSQLALRDSVNRGLKKNSPEIYVSYVISPNDSAPGKDAVEKMVQRAKDQNYDFIKYLGGMKEENFGYLAASCRTNNFPLAGHAFQGNLLSSIRADYVSVEHYQPLLKEYKKDGEDFRKLLDTLKTRKVAICPTLSFYRIYNFEWTENELKSRNGTKYVSDKVYNQWLKTYKDDMAAAKLKMKENFDTHYVQAGKENLAKFGQALKSAADAGVCVLLSADECAFNVPGFSMYEEMKLYKQAGLSNYQILKCATLNAAVCLKEQKNWGSIEIGKKANLVLLNGNPLEDIEHIKDVEAVIMHGKYYRQNELLKGSK